MFQSRVDVKLMFKWADLVLNLALPCGRTAGAAVGSLVFCYLESPSQHKY